ncbi:MAG: hypothetical protein QMC95_18095 [Desulfitobacteriaceae bacterium]|nr:hypothetical protein [Desulfitobacteriaceae bacterium]
MKKIIFSIILILTACVALCAAVWPRNVEDRNVAEPEKSGVTAGIEDRSEEIPKILISASAAAPEAEAVAESETLKPEITAEEKIESMQPTETAPLTISRSAPVNSEPKAGDETVIDGKPYVWIPGFGWIKDEGGKSVGTTVGNPGDELTGNKVGQMGAATVGSDGDINKQVGIMGGGTVAEDMYENGHKIGIMGSWESASHETNAHVEPPEPTCDVIYIELQPPVTKDSTPPPYNSSLTARPPKITYQKPESRVVTRFFAAQC